MDFSVESKPLTGNYWILALKGPVDSVNYDSFDQEAEHVLEKGARHILLDMSDIDSIDTAGIDAIFGLKKVLEERHGSLRVYDPFDKVRKSFEIVRLLHLTVNPKEIAADHPYYKYLNN